MTISPDTENYYLGRGIIYFSPLLSSVYQGERDLGNASAFSINFPVQKTNYFSPEGGTSASNKVEHHKISPSVSFVLDEINSKNVAMLGLGTITTVTQGTLPGDYIYLNEPAWRVLDEEVVAFPGTRFALTKRNLTDIVLSLSIKNEAKTKTYVKGEDYQIYNSTQDKKTGRIFVLPGGEITAGQTLLVSYSYAAVTYDKISIFKNYPIEGFLRFVSDNQEGPFCEAQIWRVQLSPENSFDLISDSWTELSFIGEILEDSTKTTTPYMDIIMEE